MRAALIFLSLFNGILAFGQNEASLNKNRIGLPNGWSLTPVGKSLPLGDLPLNLVVSVDQRLAAVTNNGQSTQSIHLFDTRKQLLLDSVVVEKSWYGLTFSKDNRYLYASGGNDNCILRFTIRNNKLGSPDSLVLGPKWPVRISPAGMALDDKRQLLYIVTRENNRLYIFDLEKNKVASSFQLPGEAYTCLLAPDNRELYISCWGCDSVLRFNTVEKNFSKAIKVGDNPNEMVLTRSGKKLFVCNANDNSVSVIDVSTGSVSETLNAALYPDAPTGSTTNAVALNADEKRLYIANADNNCIAVFDISGRSATPTGFIPTGWYPTSVKEINKQLWVTNGKGFSSMPNPQGPNPTKRGEPVSVQQGEKSRHTVQYIAGLFQGTLSIISLPAQKQLEVFTRAVYANTPYSKKRELEAEGEKGNPVPTKAGQTSPIKYVFYVVKENRTYDQVLGDMPEGRGDASLVLFGERITPNQHRLARDFVLLDNFYVNAEVSADGHNWSMGAYATDYLEKTWPTHYGKRGGNYEGEGKRAIANNRGGFIWDHCARQGVSYRTYGEFADNQKPNIPSIRNHFCRSFKDFDLSVRDTTRYYQWQRDFDSLLANNALPQLSTIRFGNDHTEGLKKGKPTPYAHVADNDWAVGLFIEHLAQSPIWNESVVFILEDDAQNGADHIDAHRSTAYIAGGMVKRGIVDHTLYTTTSVLRTIELILGISPMSQYDAAATPLWRCFNSASQSSSFKAVQPDVDLDSRNTAINEWQRRSELLDLTREDAIPDLEFNRIIWHAVKGDIAFPGPTRAAFIRPVKDAEDDD